MGLMIGFWTDYTLNACNDAWLRGVPFTPPAALYAGLSKAKANRVNPPVELPSTGGYARASVGLANFSASAVGSTSNTVAITFPAPTVDWAAVYSLVLYDAATAGNALAIVSLAGDAVYMTRTVALGALVIPIGGIVLGRS